MQLSYKQLQWHVQRTESQGERLTGGLSMEGHSDLICLCPFVLDLKGPTALPTRIPTPFPTTAPTKVPTGSPTIRPTRVGVGLLRGITRLIPMTQTLLCAPRRHIKETSTAIPSCLWSQFEPRRLILIPQVPTGRPTVLPTGSPTKRPTALPTLPPTAPPTQASPLSRR